MNVYPRNSVPQEKVKKFIIIFYTIGVSGFILPYTRELFIRVTPAALLLSAYLLLAFHNNKSKKDWYAFLLIYVLGFSVEAIGVNTGSIFGHYEYGNALGLKILHTPLLIGINWLFLTYSGMSMAEKITGKPGMQLLAAPSFMLLYDFILEQVAPRMNMWNWQNAEIPLKNYLAWWCIGLLFATVLKLFKTDTKNPLAIFLFVCQFIFIALLLLGFNLIK